MIKGFGICMLLLAASSGTVLAQNFPTIEPKIESIDKHLYLLRGNGGNIVFSAGNDGILMVDSQFKETAPSVEQAIKSIVNLDINILLNTGWHPDLAGGNAHFGQKAIIIAQDLIKERLAAPQNIDLLGLHLASGAPSSLPMITFDKTLTISYNEDEIKIWHLPSGHASGDSAVYFTKSNVLHTGPIFINQSFPFIDIENGGNALELRNNVKILVAAVNAQTKIIPSRGTMTSMAELQGYLEMLEETIAFVESMLKDGKSLEDIKTSGLPEKWSVWDKGYITGKMWIHLIYNSLAKV